VNEGVGAIRIFEHLCEELIIEKPWEIVEKWNEQTE
jgi:hypothetical protein